MPFFSGAGDRRRCPALVLNVGVGFRLMRRGSVGREEGRGGGGDRSGWEQQARRGEAMWTGRAGEAGGGWRGKGAPCVGVVFQARAVQL